jgi:L-alanine-DL-glutamate epimerase-like enolase superfamily enzyme
MKIVNILQRTVRLQSNISNALVNFSSHTVSLVALVSDQVRHGRPVVGFAFNSIGRFAQDGILSGRMIPRLLQAAPESLLQEDGRLLSPEKILACAMQNEKPGGHGDRAHAAAALELAAWDLNAKLNDEPAAVTIARHYGQAADERISVYAAGGYYYPGESGAALQREIDGYRARGFTRFKMKIGGATMAEDLDRVEAAVKAAGAGSNLAVDANGRFDAIQAIEYGRRLQDFGLMWYEEACDPLDFEANSQLAAQYKGALATGENLFSHQDVKNLVLFGGARPKLDIFQMDSGLSYGVTGYVRMLQELEGRGFSRRYAYPHGGQLMALHVVAGLGLGGSEVYPGVFQPIGGFADDTVIENGSVRLPQQPGFGFEAKTELHHEFKQLF